MEQAKKRHSPYTDVHFDLLYKLGKEIQASAIFMVDAQYAAVAADIDAGYFFIIHNYLMQGKQYKRAMSAEAYSFYLSKIYDDYGSQQLSKSLYP